MSFSASKNTLWLELRFRPSSLALGHQHADILSKPPPLRLLLASERQGGGTLKIYTPWCASEVEFLRTTMPLCLAG